MDRGHSRTFVGAALATGLVGLVTLPATPTGHRPPALWKKPKNSVQSRRSIRSLRSSRNEVREGLRSIKSSKNAQGPDDQLNLIVNHSQRTGCGLAIERNASLLQHPGFNLFVVNP